MFWRLLPRQKRGRVRMMASPNGQSFSVASLLFAAEGVFVKPTLALFAGRAPDSAGTS
jgi:hypothetical protein